MILESLVRSGVVLRIRGGWYLSHSFVHSDHRDRLAACKAHLKELSQALGNESWELDAWCSDTVRIYHPVLQGRFVKEIAS